jgi:hypothetical protein
MLAGCVAFFLVTAYGHAQEEEELDPLAELAALGDEAVDTGPEGGGSIRAKKDADLSRTRRLKDPKNLEARVEEVITKGFPIVAVKVKVSRPAKEGEGKKIAKNTKLVLLPRLVVEGKSVALEDEATRINAGAYYLKKGDKVAVRLGENRKSNLWQADYIERK